MKRTLTFWLTLALGAALAAGYPAFEAAYLKASPELLKAEAELKTAGARAQALKDDRYAAPFERAQAEDAALRAQALLKKTTLGLRQQALETFAAVPLARAALKLAEARLAYAELAAKAAQIRFERGAISNVERDRAQSALAEARAAVEKARTRLEAAEVALKRYGAFAAEAVPELPLPERRSAEAHPDHLLARLELRAAERALRAAEAPDTPRIETERRRAAFEAAKAAFGAKTTELERLLSQREADHRAALRDLALKTGALTLKTEALQAARLRFEKGTASRLEVLKAVLDLKSAELEVSQARLALARAALGLWAFAEEGAR